VGTALLLAPLLRMGWWGFPAFLAALAAILLGTKVVTKAELQPLWGGIRR
jgi:hypothetical protein